TVRTVRSRSRNDPQNQQDSRCASDKCYCEPGQALAPSRTSTTCKEDPRNWDTRGLQHNLASTSPTTRRSSSNSGSRPKTCKSGPDKYCPCRTSQESRTSTRKSPRNPPPTRQRKNRSFRPHIHRRRQTRISLVPKMEPQTLPSRNADHRGQCGTRWQSYGSLQPSTQRPRNAQVQQPTRNRRTAA